MTPGSLGDITPEEIQEKEELDFLKDEAEHSAFYHCPARTFFQFVVWTVFAYRRKTYEANDEIYQRRNQEICGETSKMKPVYLICGVSGSGKSWVCRQLTEKFHYVPHDRCWTHPTARPDETLDPTWKEGAVSTHVETIVTTAREATKPVLTECPFAERGIREQLETHGIKVIPYFVVEDPSVVALRYFDREKKPLPKAAYTRATTIKHRAVEWDAPLGRSHEILEKLKDLVLE